jgi:hypothetical protein
MMSSKKESSRMILSAGPLHLYTLEVKLTSSLLAACRFICILISQVLTSVPILVPAGKLVFEFFEICSW